MLSGSCTDLCSVLLLLWGASLTLGSGRRRRGLPGCGLAPVPRVEVPRNCRNWEEGKGHTQVKRKTDNRQVWLGGGGASNLCNPDLIQCYVLCFIIVQIV